MVNWPDIFQKCTSFRVIVLGDLMVDAYTIGTVQRISPEAPVPIIQVKKQEKRPGGAGNAMLNLAALSGNVRCIGRVGADAEGNQLASLLQAKGMNTQSLFVQQGYETPVKNRLIADNQQLMRVDFETLTPLDAQIERDAIEALRRFIPQSDVLAISDYGKGFLSETLLQEALTLAKKHQIPSIVDPKGNEFTKYRGVFLLKPNLSEAYLATHLPRSTPLKTVASHLLEKTQAQFLLITRSEAGISLFDQSGEQFDFPVRFKEVKDVTGAGDTVLAILGLCLAHGIDIQLATQLANVGAGLSIERMGCVQITLSEMEERCKELKMMPPPRQMSWV